MAKHLASYDFRGSRWSVEIEADSASEAQARLEAMRRSLVYDGEVLFTVHIPSPVPWWRRLFGGSDAR